VIASIEQALFSRNKINLTVVLKARYLLNICGTRSIMAILSDNHETGDKYPRDGSAVRPIHHGS